MISEKIIINGVDVSGCEHLDKCKHCKLCNSKRVCLQEPDLRCESFADCTYKRLQVWKLHYTSLRKKYEKLKEKRANANKQALHNLAEAYHYKKALYEIAKIAQEQCGDNHDGYIIEKDF